MRDGVDRMRRRFDIHSLTNSMAWGRRCLESTDDMTDSAWIEIKFIVIFHVEEIDVNSNLWSSRLQTPLASTLHYIQDNNRICSGLQQRWSYTCWRSRITIGYALASGDSQLSCTPSPWIYSPLKLVCGSASYTIDDVERNSIRVRRGLQIKLENKTSVASATLRILRYRKIYWVSRPSYVGISISRGTIVSDLLFPISDVVCIFTLFVVRVY